MFIPCRLRYRDGENVKDLFGVGIKKSPGQQRFSVLLAEDEKVRCCAQGADGESGSSPTCPLDASSRHRRGGGIVQPGSLRSTGQPTPSTSWRRLQKAASQDIKRSEKSRRLFHALSRCESFEDPACRSRVESLAKLPLRTIACPCNSRELSRGDRTR